MKPLAVSALAVPLAIAGAGGALADQNLSPRQVALKAESNRMAIVQQWRNIAARMVYLIDKAEPSIPGAAVVAEIVAFDLHSYKLAGVLGIEGGAETDEVRAVADRVRSEVTAADRASDGPEKTQAWRALRETLEIVAEG